MMADRPPTPPDTPPFDSALPRDANVACPSLDTNETLHLHHHHMPDIALEPISVPPLVSVPTPEPERPSCDLPITPISPQHAKSSPAFTRNDIDARIAQGESLIIF